MKTSHLILSALTVTSIATVSAFASQLQSETAQLAAAQSGPVMNPASTRYIVQLGSTQAAREAVNQVAGEVLTDFNLINGVGAQLSPEQARRLRQAFPQARLHVDGRLKLAGNTKNKGKGASATVPQETDHPEMIDANELHVQGIVGSGVTIAFLDSGMWVDEGQVHEGLLLGTNQRPGRVLKNIEMLESSNDDAFDDYGHGSHIASVAASSYRTPDGGYQGIAPDADLISIKAFDRNGGATYYDVISGIEWVITHREKYNIRVLNLSFGAAPSSHYWDDPVNQAVMAAWQAGIVVVTSAGNEGPEPMSIGVPGNVPYVITVGAADDNHTPFDRSDDFLSSFSSAGPTFEGFVKPDLIAPGARLTGMIHPGSLLSNNHEAHLLEDRKHFRMSGTSQSAAVVSGVVALMLQHNPDLSPDDVKCRLASSAYAATAGSDAHYSVFQQGAGLVNARDAVYSTASGCANLGLDLAADLAGEKHFAGPVEEDEQGNFVIRDENGELTELNGDAFIWSRSYIWSRAYVWSQAFIWSRSYIWSRAFIWSRAYAWSRSYPWDTSDSAGTTTDLASNTTVVRSLSNRWVEPEAQRYQD